MRAKEKEYVSDLKS